MNTIKALIILSFALVLGVTAQEQVYGGEAKQSAAALIIDHNCTDISKIPREFIEKAKQEFIILYAHSSYGGQIIGGMEAMKSELYAFTSNAREPGLQLHEMEGNLGHKGDLRWRDGVPGRKGVRELLQTEQRGCNLVIIAWENGCSNNTPQGIAAYLKAMAGLEKEFPGKTFVYMTGHVDGFGAGSLLEKANNKIRKFCEDYNKVLYDFADIESFDPDGKPFFDLHVTDACFYRKGMKGGNWAREWLKRNPDHGIPLPEPLNAPHTHPLNAALKGRAFWWMLARLAGWEGVPPSEPAQP